MLGQYFYRQARPPLQAHLHQDVFEICILEQGTQTYFVEACRYDLVGGDAFITKPGEVHSTGNEPEHKGRLYWLELHANPPGASVLGLSPDESGMLCRRLLHLPVRHLRRVGDVLVPTLQRIAAMFPDRQNPMRIADLRNLLLRLLLDFVTCAEQAASPRPDPGVMRALRHIRKDPTSAMSVASLASQARLSESHFKKQFKLQMGMPPIEYVMQCRIERGKQLLLRNNLAITQIAQDAGFATSQHFATVFKRFTGFTPRAFRHAAETRPRPATPAVGEGVHFHPVT